jgi:glutathione S-transferase
MALELYDGQRSWNARKVRLLAAELGIEIQSVRLDFAKGEFRSQEYLAKNPNGKIPTLEEDDFVLWESHAILIYLADQHPERGLHPTDPKQRALVDQWLFWWTAHIEPALNLLLVERRIKPFLKQPANDPSIIARANSELDRFLPILDTQLSTREHVVGPLSIVDFAMAAQLEQAPMIELDISRYDNIGRWLERLQKKPYWKEA